MVTQLKGTLFSQGGGITEQCFQQRLHKTNLNRQAQSRKQEVPIWHACDWLVVEEDPLSRTCQPKTAQLKISVTSDIFVSRAILVSISACKTLYTVPTCGSATGCLNELPSTSQPKDPCARQSFLPKVFPLCFKFRERLLLYSTYLHYMPCFPPLGHKIVFKYLNIEGQMAIELPVVWTQTNNITSCRIYGAQREPGDRCLSRSMHARFHVTLEEGWRPHKRAQLWECCLPASPNVTKNTRRVRRASNRLWRRLSCDGC